MSIGGTFNALRLTSALEWNFPFSSTRTPPPGALGIIRRKMHRAGMQDFSLWKVPIYEAFDDLNPKMGIEEAYKKEVESDGSML